MPLVSFAVSADAYDRFMGRYAVTLAPQLAALAEVAVGQRVLDVGCGPGALTTELVRRLDAAASPGRATAPCRCCAVRPCRDAGTSDGQCGLA